MKIPQQVLDELVLVRKRAQEHSHMFSEIIKAQAEKHRIKPAALRAYIVALADDKLNDLGQLADQLVSLIDDDQPDLFSTAKEAGASVEGTDPETGEVIFASQVNE